MSGGVATAILEEPTGDSLFPRLHRHLDSEFDITAIGGFTRSARSATWRSLQAGSGSSRNPVGGSQPRRSGSSAAANSRAPALPSKWPCSDLVELTGTCAAYSRVNTYYATQYPNGYVDYGNLFAAQAELEAQGLVWKRTEPAFVRSE